MSALPCRSCTHVNEGTVSLNETVDSHSGFSCKLGCTVKDRDILVYGVKEQEEGALICKVYLHEGFSW
jgi:hypothetical protein